MAFTGKFVYIRVVLKNYKVMHVSKISSNRLLKTRENLNYS